MAPIVFCFVVHHPWPLRAYTTFDRSGRYFDESAARAWCRSSIEGHHLPIANELLALIAKAPTRFGASYLISGVCLEQLQAFCPQMIDALRKLHDTGCIDFVAESYHHSFALGSDQDEFCEQVALHRELLHELFGTTPRVFCPTDRVLSSPAVAIAQATNHAGFLCQSCDNTRSLHAETTNRDNAGESSLAIFEGESQLDRLVCGSLYTSDGARTTHLEEKLASAASRRPSNDPLVVMLDSPTAEEKTARSMPSSHGAASPVQLMAETSALADAIVFKSAGMCLALPLTTTSCGADSPDIQVPPAVGGNRLQIDAADAILKLGAAARESGSDALLACWRRLQCADYLAAMGDQPTKSSLPQELSKKIGNYDYYIRAMNIVEDLARRCKQLADSSR